MLAHQNTGNPCDSSGYSKEVGQAPGQRNHCHHLKIDQIYIFDMPSGTQPALLVQIQRNQTQNRLNLHKKPF